MTSPRQRPWITLLVVLAIASVIPFFHHHKTHHDCLACRARRHAFTTLGIPFHWVRETAFSRAYVQKHPQHAHQWRWCGSQREVTFLSEAMASGRRHPVFTLRPEVQEAYWKQVEPEVYAKFLRQMDTLPEASSGNNPRNFGSGFEEY